LCKQDPAGLKAAVELGAFG